MFLQHYTDDGKFVKLVGIAIMKTTIATTVKRLWIIIVIENTSIKNSSQKENYLNAVKNAYSENATEWDNSFFAHYLDCEAHSDVWRELFPTYNKTNEK